MYLLSTFSFTVKRTSMLMIQIQFLLLPSKLILLLLLLKKPMDFFFTTTTNW
jgi:hypothetical protein